jgi:hypothetical protein
MSTTARARLHRGRERREILALAVATRDQHHRLPQAGERSHRCAHVGAFRVIEKQDTLQLGHVLHAMRQPLE